MNETMPTEAPPAKRLSPEEESELFFKIVAEAMELLDDAVRTVLVRTEFGSTRPAYLAVPAVVHALVLLGMGVGREQRLPTKVLADILSQTLGWVQDPTHVFGKDHTEPFIEEIEPPAPKG